MGHRAKKSSNSRWRQGPIKSENIAQVILKACLITNSFASFNREKLLEKKSKSKVFDYYSLLLVSRVVSRM